MKGSFFNGFYNIGKVKQSRRGSHKSIVKNGELQYTCKQ